MATGKASSGILTSRESNAAKCSPARPRRRPKQKITAYIAQFNEEVHNSDESQKTIKDSLTHWLQIFKCPSRGADDLRQTGMYCPAQVFPLIGEKIVGDITAADLKSVLNHWMEQGYAYTTVKKVHNLLSEFFRYLTEEDFIQKNPMQKRPYDEESQLPSGTRIRSVCQSRRL